MRTGDANGLDVIYDDEAQLILSDRERLYGRRGLRVEAYAVARLTKKPLVEESLWMVYFTNRRVVGLQDLTHGEEERHHGTLRPVDRARFMGLPVEAQKALRYFELPFEDILRVGTRRRRYLWIRVQTQDEAYEFRFRPWGGASRFFSNLLTQTRS